MQLIHIPHTTGMKPWRMSKFSNINLHLFLVVMIEYDTLQRLHYTKYVVNKRLETDFNKHEFQLLSQNF